MAEKKSSAVLLTVIGIATLLVTLVGATFAFFSAQVANSEDSVDTDVVITAAKLGSIVFDHTNAINLSNAYPGDTQTIKFSVNQEEASTADVKYNVYLVVESNNFITNNLTGTLTAPEGDTSKMTSASLISTGTYANSEKVLIGTGTLEAGEQADSDEWSINVTLTETNEEQNDDQGKVFQARIEVELEGASGEVTQQYTQESVYGTTSAAS